ncbi:MAG: glycosyltransferase family 2 protein [Steroidobacter sp.]
MCRRCSCHSHPLSMIVTPHSRDNARNHGAARISIALCTYNGAPYLREQLESLLVQTHSNFEIVAVDDCSTDETVTILNEYALRDARIKVHINPVNLGVKNNFMGAFEKCTGEYIAPCDQDDIWEPQKLAMLLEHIDRCALVYCDSALISEQGQPLNKRISDLVSMLSTNDPGNLLFYNCVSGHAMLFRREVLNEVMPFPDEYLYDWWLAMVAAASGGIRFVDHPLVKHRWHSNNATGIFRNRTSAKEYKPGYRLDLLRAVGNKLEALVALPGEHQQYIVRLNALWRRREQQWLSPALAFFMVCNGRRLYATLKRATVLFAIRRAIYFMWGIRTKRIANDYAFSASAQKPGLGMRQKIDVQKVESKY